MGYDVHLDRDYPIALAFNYRDLEKCNLNYASYGYPFIMLRGLKPGPDDDFLQ